MAFRVFVSVRGEEFFPKQEAAESETEQLQRLMAGPIRNSNEVGATFTAEGRTFNEAADAATAKAKAFLAGAGYAMEEGTSRPTVN